MKKKLLALLLAVAVMASLVVLPAQALSAADFTDVPADSWFYEDVDFVTTHGYFIGRGNGIFAPDDMLTREELATVLARLDGANLSNNDVSPYADVEAGRWSAAAIQWMKNTRLTQGTGGDNFNPTGQLTRQELAVFVARFVEYYTARHNYRLAPKLVVPEFPDLEDADEWAREAIETDRKNGLIYGFQDNCFYPKLTSTRAQIAAIIHRLVVELSIVPTPTNRIYVTYDLNWPAGMTGAPANARRAGRTYTPYTPSAEETPVGYAFVGWNTSADGSGEDRAVGTEYNTNTSLTLYAQWIDTKDLIGMGVKASIENQVNALAAKLNGAGLVNNTITFSAKETSFQNTIKPDDTRAQEFAVGMALTSDFLPGLIEFVADVAVTLFRSGQPAAEAEVKAFVADVLDGIEAATGIKITKVSRDGIIDGVAKAVDSSNSILQANFVGEDGKYVFGSCTITVNGTSVTFTADAAETAVNMDCATKDAVVKMSTALFKELYADMQKISSYTSKLDLDANITVSFTDGTTHGLETAPYPHNYPATLKVTLDGDGLLEYKFSGEDYLKIKLSEKTQDAYHKAVMDIFDAALDNPSVQSVVDAELETAVGKVESSDTMKAVIRFLQKCGMTETEAKTALAAAVDAWSAANHMNGAEFKDCPLYQKTWLGQEAELEYSDLQDFLDDTAQKGADFIYNKLLTTLGGAVDPVNAMVSALTPETLAGVEGVDLSGLEGTPGIQAYIFSRICENLHAKAGKTSTFVTPEITEAMLAELEEKIMGQMPDAFDQLKSIQTLENIFTNMTFGELGDVLTNSFVMGAANEMSALVSKAQNLVKKLPDTVAVTINHTVTIDKAALAAFGSAANGADALTALAAILKTPGLAELKPADFAVDNEIPVDFTLGGGTHTIYLCFELE